MTEKRDPRAHWLDEDPFDKMDNNSKTHTRARDDGNWRKPHIRVVNANTSGQPFFRVFGTRQSQPIPIHTGSLWHFSKTEIDHLTQATFAFTIALAFMSTGGIFGALNSPSAFIEGGIVYFIALAPAFILHEIAHKIVARSYGCWAEFRVSPSGLRFGVILAAAIGIVFMAPGAVMVAGRTTLSQFGKVALAGPISNVILWLLGFVAILLGISSNPIGLKLIWPWMWGNAILATFNMLPFGELDGKKIKKWSEIIFYVWFVICISLVIFTFGELRTIIGI
jgi:Zn-dependent protease|tara:strand:+ start:510 stop:1349 length:840 start_codon:yes stop_codon:yes gene_type:complete